MNVHSPVWDNHPCQADHGAATVGREDAFMVQDPLGLGLFSLRCGFCVSSGGGGSENAESGFPRSIGTVDCFSKNRSYIHVRIHAILGGYDGILAIFH